MFKRLETETQEAQEVTKILDESARIMLNIEELEARELGAGYETETQEGKIEDEFKNNEAINKLKERGFSIENLDTIINYHSNGQGKEYKDLYRCYDANTLEKFLITAERSKRKSKLV